MTDHAAAIARYWDEAASTFDDEPDHGLRTEHTRAAWAHWLRSWMPAAPADVLDVGCGTGSLSLLLAGEGHRMTGVDLSPRMVAEARRKHSAARLPGRFLVGDAALPPTEEQRFDVVLSRHLLWTLPDPRAALAEWVGRLRPGEGRLVLIEGRWSTAGEASVPYVAGAGALPWGEGVGARELSDVLRPLVTDLHIEPLSGDQHLWGGPVSDERYGLIAWV